jgi:CheY-like chemotaxis protein
LDKNKQPPQGGEQKIRRVLVVDDNMDWVTSLAMTLKIMGHEVRTALNGVSALETAAIFAPDLVLLDIGLPAMDGHEVAQRLRGMDATRGAVLIAVTASGRDEDRRRAREAGFDRYQLKPIAPKTLNELLELHK